jgi:hypothetical protein
VTELPPSLSPRPAGDKRGAAAAPLATPAAAATVTPDAAGSLPAKPGPPASPVKPTGPPRVQRAEAGLTAPGVVVVVVAVSLVGLLVDRFTVDSGTVFGVAYVLACGYAALQVRRRDLVAAVVLPPLIFFLLVTGRALVDSGSSHTMSARSLQVASDLATLAPFLWIGTALAAVIVLVRWRLGLKRA